MEELIQREVKQERLSLTPVCEGLRVGIKSDGHNYSVRTDRRRYFFPDEWNNFINLLKNKEHKFFFITCLHTGGRIMEVLNLKHKDIDVERGTINFSIVKQRKAKKNFYATGKTRGFFVASEFLAEYKSFIRGKTINPEHLIFLDNSKLPTNYNELANDDRKKYYSSKVVSYSNMFKRKLKKAGIKDWYNFSPHNIRKTFGMWMRTYNKDFGELCYRMGHDMDTYIAHYGSSLIFTEEERRKIQKIMGDVK
jgi:integrase